jgi:virginiamycin B lyase
MFVTSSKSSTGELSNLTSLFSTKNFTIEPTNQTSNFNASEVIKTYNTTLDINPAEGLEPGNHTLTISARYDNDLTVSKIIDMEIL